MGGRPVVLGIVVMVAATLGVIGARSDRDDREDEGRGRSAAGALTPRAVAPGAGTVADLPVLGNVPVLDDSQGWINAPAGGPDLTGKVVLYELWTFGCINCQRTLPSLRSIYDRYRDEGLEIVGIHTPEFGYERDHERVLDATRELGVTWPVLFDDDHTNWRRFDNIYWPRIYVADAEGRLRYDHIGEGAYARTEDAVRHLLGIPADAPRAIPT